MKIKLQSIARFKADDSPMEELFAAEITDACGLRGEEAFLKEEGKEVGEITVLSKESWVKVCHETDTELPWLLHGSNLLIKGFEFLPTDLGRSFRIGEAVLEIDREMTPSMKLEKQAPDLYEALQLGWRGGVICKVIKSGSIQSGDIVDFIG